MVLTAKKLYMGVSIFEMKIFDFLEAQSHEPRLALNLLYSVYSVI